MKTPQLAVVAVLAFAALTAGCANHDYRPAPSSPRYYGAAYGVVDAIEPGRVSGDGIGAGAIIGGVVGGVLGHQVGEGRGKDVATAAGVVGGAVAGHHIEKSSRQQQDAYHIRIRLERGGYQTVTQQSVGDLRVGDRVRIENNRVIRY